jgi:hypothetical protein
MRNARRITVICALFFVLIGLALFVSPLAVGQTKPNKAVPEQQLICGKPPCIFVHVDAVSYYDSTTQKKLGLKAPMINNIMVSNGQGTYLLTCSPKEEHCITPKIGANYEFVDKGEKWTVAKDFSIEYTHEKTVFLVGEEFLGAYWLEAHVPITPGSEVQRLIATCEAKQDFPDETRCAKWLNRKEEARKAACPDAEATLACRSFQELLAANDFMGDFAEKEHVFTCFRKNDDMFFDLWFTEPAEEPELWQQENSKHRTLTHSGYAAFDYYKQGVWSFNLSVGVYGKWSYFPAGPVCDAMCQKEATSGNSKYEGHNDISGSIRIDHERAVLSESFDNKSGSKTTHEVIVQLSTGRFTERYTWPKSSSTDETEESTGRCLILTPLSSQQ